MSTPIKPKNKGDIPEQLAVIKAVNRIARLLSRAEGLEAAIEKLMSEFVELVNADEGSIQLLRPSSGTTRCTLIRQEDKGGGLLDKRLEDFLTGWVLKQKAALLSHDLLALLNLGSVPKRYAGIGSVLAAPLLSDGKTIGVVNLIRTRDSDPFSTADEQMVSELTAQVGDFVEGASLRERLFAENERLRQDLGDRFSAHGIIGQSPAIKEVYRVLEQVIPTDARVVVLGESGTGKELVARCIHYAGPRKDHPFIALDCGALPSNLLESELFGYVRGAFTGAMQDRRGLIQEAHAGTLFLDEITNMSIETQAKLLRVVQEGELRALGSNQLAKIDVRIIVATSSDLAEQVSTGKFRSDLYYRLNVVAIQMPPLRQRVEDIPLLANVFLRRFAEKHGKRVKNISPSVLQIFEKYLWPGNIRELENVIERATVMVHFDDTTLLPQHLPDDIPLSKANPTSKELPFEGDLRAFMDSYESELLMRVLSRHNWKQTAAAKALNISEAVMRYKMKRHNIRRPQ